MQRTEQRELISVRLLREMEQESAVKLMHRTQWIDLKIS